MQICLVIKPPITFGPLSFFLFAFVTDEKCKIKNKRNKKFIV